MRCRLSIVAKATTEKSRRAQERRTSPISWSAEEEMSKRIFQRCHHCLSAGILPGARDVGPFSVTRQSTQSCRHIQSSDTHLEARDLGPSSASASSAQDPASQSGEGYLSNPETTKVVMVIQQTPTPFSLFKTVKQAGEGSEKF